MSIIPLCKMKIRIGFLLYVLLLSMSGCVVLVQSDKDDTVNFYRYRTFAWIARQPASFTNPAYDNQILENNIKNVGSLELQNRGMTVDVDSPDVLFDYQIMVDQKTETVQQPVYSNPYTYNRFTGLATFTGSFVIGYRNQEIPYKEGTLTISAIDRLSNRVVWRGWAEETVDDPTTYEADLKRDMHKIMSHYPTIVVKK